jgi:beta-phosphoglucomutase-like phosphatase (HAD superfamily)
LTTVVPPYPRGTTTARGRVGPTALVCDAVGNLFPSEPPAFHASTNPSKADPDGYLHAIAAMGIAADNTMAIEDSIPGVPFAVIAGAAS